MAEGGSGKCSDCGESIGHKLFCYDVYIPSANPPQNKKQIDMDNKIKEFIVEPLEKLKFLCYHGCRDDTPGHHFIPSITKAVCIVPVTILPIYNDCTFESLLKTLLIQGFYNRYVCILFESTRTQFHNSYPCLDADDPHLLHKLTKTITNRKKDTTLERRKEKYQAMSEMESKISSASSHSGPSAPKTIENAQNSDFSQHQEMPEIREDLLNYIPNLESPYELLRYSNDSNPTISNLSSRVLTKWIIKHLMTFCKKPELREIEHMVRRCIQSNHTPDLEVPSRQHQLHFWTIAGLFISVYKDKNVQLKNELKRRTFKKQEFTQTTKTYEDIFRHSFKTLTLSLYKKIEIYSSICSRAILLETLETWLRIVEENRSPKGHKSEQINSITKDLRKLPWSIRHIFAILITEKIFQTGALAVCESFMYDMCTISRKKHRGIFLEVTERSTEHILENYTNGAVDECLKLLRKLWDWSIQKKAKGKRKPFKIILKHFFQMLVYHRLSHVRDVVVPLYFSKADSSVDISVLGARCIEADQNLVEGCIRNRLIRSYSELTIKSKLEEHSQCLIFKAATPEGDALLYLSAQATLNDLLQTNSTDDFYERFQEMGTVVNKCQNSDYVVRLHKMHIDSAPHFFVIENGKPLLQYLHENENLLTLLNMIDLLKDITNAVLHCHQNKVILRNITPANFFIFTENESSSLKMRAKLFSFQQAKVLPEQNTNREQIAEDNYENENGPSIEGELGEPLAVYFSAPESLKSRLFYKRSDAWMVAATFYSVLLYGRNPYVELAHLELPSLVNEVSEGYTAKKPSSIPQELWDLIAKNLNVNPEVRMTMKTLLEKLEACKGSLGAKVNNVYAVKSRTSPIRPEDIEMGFFNEEGIFEQSQPEDTDTRGIEDETTKSNYLSEKVSLRMNVKTRLALQYLVHDHLLKVVKITKNCLSTELISERFSDYSLTLEEVTSRRYMARHLLLAYFEQIVSALQHLHSKNILHCDLRCCFIYISNQKRKIKVGRFGRAVCLEESDEDQSVYRMMPAEAKPWSALEVIENGMYSKASDMYSLAALFCEAMTPRETFLTMGYQEKVRSFYWLENHLDPERGKPEKRSDHLHVLCKALADKLKGCLNPNPAIRPSAENILEDIKKLNHEMCRFRPLPEISSPAPNDTGEDDYEELPCESVREENLYTVLGQSTKPDPQLGRSKEAPLYTLTQEAKKGNDAMLIAQEDGTSLRQPTGNMADCTKHLSTKLALIHSNEALDHKDCSRIVELVGGPVCELDYGSRIVLPTGDRVSGPAEGSGIIGPAGNLVGEMDPDVYMSVLLDDSRL